MPRLPKLPGANPAASPAVLVALTQGLRCRDHVDLAAALAALGQVEAAEAVVDQITHDPIASIVVLAWMAWCCPDSKAKATWKRRAKAKWKRRDKDRNLGRIGVSACAGMALLAANPTDLLAAAREGISDDHDVPNLARTLVALGRLEEAIALLEEAGGWWTGTGWATGLMRQQDDGFTHHLIAHLVAAQRWDLLGRCMTGLAEGDHVFLGTMSLRIALEGHPDAAEALAVVPQSVLRNAFLGVLVSLPPDVRPTMAALLPALPPHRRALGEVLLGDPSKADALMAREDDAGCQWDPALLAIARDDAAGLEAIDLTGEHAARRTIIGGLRVLSIQGGPARITPWIPRLIALAHGIRRASDRPALLADTGRVLCELGCVDAGQALLEEALVMADGMPKGSDSWLRSSALTRVGSCAIRAGAVPTALQALRRCTAKHDRATLALRIAMFYREAGDVFGTERILTYIKADQHAAREDAIQQVLWRSLPDWRCRWSRSTAPEAG